jgi:mRNA-degrading endonuclease RelE of RelBE toxin-antitoxin system
MSLSENSTAYSVEVASTAWKQLSHLPLENYRRIRHELDAVAARLAGMEASTMALLKAVCEFTSLSLTVGEYVVLYDMDPERRRLHLLEVACRLPSDT